MTIEWISKPFFNYFKNSLLSVIIKKFFCLVYVSFFKPSYLVSQYSSMDYGLMFY